MKPTAADWRALRTPLLLLTAILLLGGALALLTQRGLEQARVARAAQESALNAARERWRKSGDERDRIMRYRDEYESLRQLGFVGEEQRINWVDALRAASLNLKLFGITYQIEARQPLASPANMATGHYRLHQSEMRIKMGLLHEEDLPRFMSVLAAQGAGIFTIRECSLQRQSVEATAEARLQPHLLAECSLDWITISGEGKS